ncbi:omega-conotoxin-like protein 1 [Teleopsis dalmanni]|uniref:omega-conotoxin-like protein 1 n=1 Tax=Teleopsis dalmanni TaxID=139649 RepID=UPI0018CDAB41|nr:omega-conotoxin-like protein 1 [Teleopsis dalmanni]
MKFLSLFAIFLVICLSIQLNSCEENDGSLLLNRFKRASCGRHGDPCVSDSQCCANIKCHRYANRCQVTITEEELIAGKRNLKHVEIQN